MDAEKEIDLYKMVLLLLFGIQIVTFVCLLAAEKRISLLESSHEKPAEQK